MSETKLQREIRAYLAETGLSERSLSLRARLNEKAVTQILGGRSRHPRIDTIEALAMVMNRTVAELTDGTGSGDEAGGVGATSSPPALPRLHEMPRDVPVYGTAMGANGDGAFTINLTGQIDTVRRGPGIANTQGAFATKADRRIDGGTRERSHT